MDKEKEALLDLYLKKLHMLTQTYLDENESSVLEALKVSLRYLEGEMTGY